MGRHPLIRGLVKRIERGGLRSRVPSGSATTRFCSTRSLRTYVLGLSGHVSTRSLEGTSKRNVKEHNGLRDSLQTDDIVGDVEEEEHQH
jgi:hypothetical protein